MNQEITRLFDFAYHQLATNPLDKCFNTKVGNKWIPTSTKQYIEQANTISRAYASSYSRIRVYWKTGDLPL